MSPNAHMTAYAFLACAYLAKGVRHGEGDDLAISMAYLSLICGFDVQVGLQWLKGWIKQKLLDLRLQAGRLAADIRSIVGGIVRKRAQAEAAICRLRNSSGT